MISLFFIGQLGALLRQMKMDPMEFFVRTVKFDIDLFI